MNTQEALKIASLLVEEWVWTTETERPEPNRLDVKLTKLDDFIPIVVGLRVQRLGYLSAITGLDLGPEVGELEVLYHFCTAAAVVTLRLRVPRDNPSVPSLCSIIPSAEPFERELREMFGVDVDKHPNPIHIYLPDDWPVDTYPLRKDFEQGTVSTAVRRGVKHDGKENNG
ncbi:MAG TPA: NADH-quinone oxidoreductase subunit C [Anaerolineae bacterium]|nr:NADH-quinone oxidoreductase subunit C [Anaerolineae bacterium]